MVLFSCMSILTLTSKQLRKAASIKDQIEKLKNKLDNILGGESSTPAKTAKPRRKLSKAVRAKMAAAAKLRWAKQKRTAKPVKKARRKMSAAAKARISVAAKARWKKAKLAGKNKL